MHVRYAVYLIIFFFGMPGVSVRRANLENEMLQKGTLIIAGVGSDGILIAIDSRITDLTNEVKQQAKFYRDSCQKMFIVRGVPIAIAGAFNFGSQPAWEYIKDYNDVDPTRKGTCKEVFVTFIQDLIIAFPKSRYSDLTRNYFITAGYINDSAEILSCKDGILEGGYASIVLSKRDAKSSLYKYLPDTAYLKRLPCTKLQHIFTKAIADFGRLNLTVGGPVSIIKINPDNSYSCIQNDFSKKPLGASTRHPIPSKDSAKWNKSINQ